MSYICLILSGAALLVNGLCLLGHIPGRDASVFSLLIGGTQLVLATLVAVAAHGDASTLLGASGIFLFGLTYAYVGIDGLAGLGGRGLGFFCGLVAALGIVFTALDATVDPLLAVLWLSWAALWSLFLLLLGFDRSRLTRFTGWALVLAGQVTTIIPAILGLTGTWPAGAGAAVVAAIVIAALFVIAAVLVRRTPRAEPAQVTTPGEVVSA